MSERSMAVARKEVSDILNGIHPDKQMVAIIGPCSAHEATVDQIAEEGERIRALQSELGSIALIHRMPVWKPRSRAEDWHGLETTSPEAASSLLQSEAAKGGRVAIEVALPEHMPRYKESLTLGWTGSRNVDNRQQLIDMSMEDPLLPMGVKNGMSGRIDDSMKLAADIMMVRSAAVQETAPAVVIFRGGEELRTPIEVQRAYIAALARTAGNLIYDTAHGTEMAHDPRGGFKKSVPGQVASMNMAIDLAEQNIVPRGIMIEASDTESRTDPNMPLDIAMNGLRRLDSILSRR